MAKTLLKRILIRKFRALSNVDIEFGTDLTVICGKNGTAKSSILGIAAQVFSFDKDYSTNEVLSFRTVTEEPFKSKFRDHFRVSPNFDVTGSMEIGIEVQDGYSGTDATGQLTITTRVTKSGPRPRAVVRNNSAATNGKNRDRNFTHPVIYLSLKRLYPIASREKYEEKEFNYLKDTNNRQYFINLTNELLGKQADKLTGTTGTLNSTVSHGSTYDCNSVSTGEDNVGQIVLALLSFRKLKEEYGSKYLGGLLLIDEADAGLFPSAQTKLVEILDREAKDLQLQVLLTSHSVTLIEHAFQDSQKRWNRSRIKTVYLTDTYGSVQAKHDWSWAQIYADINTQLIKTDAGPLPRTNIYFEDAEGEDFFKALVGRHKIKKLLNIYQVSLGCDNYINLIRKGIPEFSEHSIVCLDGDAQTKAEDFDTVVCLPAELPPDQLIFQYLYNKDASDPIWQNDIGFTRPVFTRITSTLISTLSISGATVDLASILEVYRKMTDKKKARELFKDELYKKPEFQDFLKLKGKSNPWQSWISENPEAKPAFLKDLTTKLKRIIRKCYGVDEARLAFLE